MVCFSAGVGRTGTFIALDSLLDQGKAEGQIDVHGLVSQIRRERMNMIQTQARLCNVLCKTLIVTFCARLHCKIVCFNSFLHSRHIIVLILFGGHSSVT